MRKKVIYELKALYRDNMRITGYEFGIGEKSACIVGAMRGNEIQQLYTCSMLVKKLRELEEQGRINEGHSIMVIPSANPYSMNIKKRFWTTDNTDINRMFPGYDMGETTQRIAGGLFDAIKDYRLGMQFASFYMPGTFTPHIRIMKVGDNPDIELAKQFGMPYIFLRNVRPYDTTTLNYNWQLWETKAFSIYTTTTTKIDSDSAAAAVKSVLRFLSKQGILEYEGHDGYHSMVIEDTQQISVRTNVAGIFESVVKVGEEVKKGQILAYVTDPYVGEVIEILRAPEDGIVFFEQDDPLAYANTAVIKLIKREV